MGLFPQNGLTVRTELRQGLCRGQFFRPDRKIVRIAANGRIDGPTVRQDMLPQVPVFNIAQEFRAIRLGMKILPSQSGPRLLHVKKRKQARWGLVGRKARRLLPDVRQRGPG